MIHRAFAPALVSALALAAFCSAAIVQESGPILIESQGAFAIGGSVVGEDQASQHCDHGVAEYQIPPDARAVNLLMWHSASAAAFQNRWDGGEGYQSIFVRRGWPVYIWDGPRVGRANWGCEPYLYEPNFGRDQQNWNSWRLGPAYGEYYPGLQFPVDDAEAMNQAMRARYQEFDTLENIRLQAPAAAALVDRIGPTVAVTNSAGGLRAMLAATLTPNIVGVYAYESAGYVFPEGEGPGAGDGPFGPITVPLDEFMALTRIPIAIVFGDHVPGSNFESVREMALLFAEVVNRHGGDATVIDLPALGLSGNTHLPFADMNNVAVADLLSEFLAEKGLDGR